MDGMKLRVPSNLQLTSEVRAMIGKARANTKVTRAKSRGHGVEELKTFANFVFARPLRVFRRSLLFEVLLAVVSEGK